MEHTATSFTNRYIVLSPKSDLAIDSRRVLILLQRIGSHHNTTVENRPFHALTPLNGGFECYGDISTIFKIARQHAILGNDSPDLAN